MRLLHVTDVLPCAGKEFIPADAMYRGRWVHDACHLLDTGRMTPAVKEAAPQWWGYVEAWVRCKAELGIVVVASEEPVVARGYCGKLDKRAVMRGRRGGGILDLKLCATGSGAIPDTTGLQTAGYVGERKLWRGAVALHPDGTYRWHDDRNNTEVFKPTDWREFCARLYVMQQDINRGWAEMPPDREE